MEPAQSVESKSPTIFLSHSSTDKAFARRLGDLLTRVGVKVWIDETEIKPGDSLVDKIERAISEIDVLAVIISPEKRTS